MTQQPWGQPPVQGPGWGQQPPPPWGQPVVQQRPPQGYPQPARYLGQPGGLPPGQRAGSPLKLVLLGVIAVIAVGFFAFSLTSFLTGSGEVAGPGPLPPTTAPPTPQPVPTPEPEPTPEVGETSAPPTGVPEPDFNPPDLPFPQSRDEAIAWLTQNAVYAESVHVPTNCTLSRIDIQAATVDQLQEHLNTLTGCLMMVWQEPMTQAGHIMPRPPITVYTAPLTTACGEVSGANAAYCPADQRLYYAYNIQEIFLQFNPQVIDNAFLPDYVMGHEFGHAMQGRAGITAARYVGLEKVESEAEKLEWSRRSELQADCFAGVFLNAVSKASRMTEADRLEILEIADAIGDDSLAGRPDAIGNHGSGDNRKRWLSTGLPTEQAGVCNPWVAPSDQVR